MLSMKVTMNAREILTKTIENIDGAYAPSTIRAYKTSFERFIQFCDDYQVNALPANPPNVAQYISKLTTGGLKSSTIRIMVAAISSIHKLNLYHRILCWVTQNIELMNA